MKWQMPHVIEGVRYRYEDGKYRAEIYERPTDRQDWSWRILKSGYPVCAGASDKLYKAKYECQRFIEFAKENESDD